MHRQIAVKSMKTRQNPASGPRTVTIPSLLELRRQLTQAVRELDEKQVKKLLIEHNVDPNYVVDEEESQPTLLIVAVKKGNAKIVRALLRSKDFPARVNTTDKDGNTPIWFAVKYKNTSVVEELIDCSSLRCQVDYIDTKTGMSPLFLAVMNQSAEICRILIRAGANIDKGCSIPDSPDKSMDVTPLVRAIQLNNLDVCKVLTDNLVNMNLRCSNGLAPLHYAVAYRRHEILEHLLSEGAKVSIKSTKGITPMTVAISENNPYIVRKLTESGYNIDRKFAWGETSLDMAIRIHAEECSMVLVHCGFPVKSSPFSKRKVSSPFQEMCYEGLLNLANFLVALHPQFLQETWIKKREFPLSVANQHKFVQKLELLSKHPASLQQQCVSKIFILLGKCPYIKIKYLPLPDKLKQIFEFIDYFEGKGRSKRFGKKLFLQYDCPLDCPMSCLNPQCPDIEFSDSDSEFQPSSDDEDDFTISYVSQYNMACLRNT